MNYEIRERASLQFRVDVFILLNHPNFVPPISVLNNSNFGVSTQMPGRSPGSSGPLADLVRCSRLEDHARCDLH